VGEKRGHPRAAALNVRLLVASVRTDHSSRPICKELDQTCQTSDECCAAYSDIAAGGFCTCLQEGDLCMPFEGGACFFFVCGQDDRCTA
jgi:hypothetical protein